jgi:recombination associated protein RdgC
LSARTVQSFRDVQPRLVPPSGSGRLVHTVNLQHLIALEVNQKLLPSSMIRQVATERA